MALHDRDVMNKALGEPAGTPSESCDRRINNAAEELVKYMLMTDEAALPTPVSGTSGFAEDYSHRPGTPKDKRGRSLRELDLQTRLFRYHCSPLIYSEAFRALPDVAQTRVIARIRNIVTGNDTTAAYAKLSTDDRKALSEILTDTGIL